MKLICVKLKESLAKLKEKLTEYHNGDPVMIKKTVSIETAAYKKSSPDKPIMKVTLNARPEITVVQALLAAAAALSFLFALHIALKLLFKSKYKSGIKNILIFGSVRNIMPR